METLTIKITKKTDGTSVLACTRPDGTATWHRYKQPFFAFHDLTHYAIETTLGLRYGFYGLLLSGWDITDFGHRQLPPEAQADAALAEGTAGLLDQERGTGSYPDTDGFNQGLAAMHDRMGQPFTRSLTTAELDAIRAACLDLFGQWTATPTGGTLELAFNVAEGARP